MTLATKPDRGYQPVMVSVFSILLILGEFKKKTRKSSTAMGFVIYQLATRAIFISEIYGPLLLENLQKRKFESSCVKF